MQRVNAGKLRTTATPASLKIQKHRSQSSIIKIWDTR